MDATTVVWLPAPPGEQAAAEGDAREGARRALLEWARARGLSLHEPDRGGSHGIAVDLSLGDRVEADLDRAREAVTAQDANATEHALARAEATLRAHPELPQAAWLLAEVERGWAARWSRIAPVDEERAREAWRRAAALDGGRATGIGEPGAPADAPVETRVLLDGDGDLRIDGVRTTPGTVRATPGEHQFVVTRDGEVIWAEWVSLAEHAAVRIAVPEPAACSTTDLGRAHLLSRSVDAKGVLCRSWVAAVPGPRARTVLVASCERERCGPLLEWSVGGPGTQGPEVPPVHPGRWPGWATWTVVGVGVVAAVGITLVAVGAFRSSTQTQFVNGGGVVR